MLKNPDAFVDIDVDVTTPRPVLSKPLLAIQNPSLSLHQPHSVFTLIALCKQTTIVSSIHSLHSPFHSLIPSFPHLLLHSPKMRAQQVVAGFTALASLSLARPWYNTSSVAAYGTGLIGSAPIGTAPVSASFSYAPHASHSSTKAAQLSTFTTGYNPAITAAGLFSSLSSSEDGCSVSYVTVTASPVLSTTGSPAISSESSSVQKYSYAIESGTTSWFSDVAPPASSYFSTVSELSTVIVSSTTTSEASVLVSTITATAYSTTTLKVSGAQPSSNEVCYLFSLSSCC